LVFVDYALPPFSVEKVFFPPAKCYTKLLVLLSHNKTLAADVFFCHHRSIYNILTAVFSQFTKLQKATISFVMSARLSAWNTWAHTSWIFMKLDM
jgi:hypothetical protein